MDTTTAELLTASIRELLADAPSDLTGALDQLGWDEVVADSPAEATALLFGEHGRALACSHALDDVVLAELATILPPASTRRAVLYPDPIDGDLLAPAGATVDGVLLSAPDDVDEFVVPITVDRSIALLVLPAAVLATSPLHGIDADLRWHRVRLAAETAAPIAADAEWQSALAAARRALAAEIIGALQVALRLAVDHTTARVQFGKPIAAFQAVRHRLAETHVALTAAVDLLDTAWNAHGDETPVAAAVAKAAAGRAQSHANRNLLQVCGAVGLTMEHDLHRYLVRAAALDHLLSSHRMLTTELGRSLLDGAAPARLFEMDTAV
ncbi:MULTISPECIES: acyl-CoA dehydrogenase family protein [Nocardia]|uniref:acyl-CoA dehydrogenase family protein n=1 Tax=Nocardia TaxID=1817 RepID=UPI000D69F1AE|nr:MULTISPECIES: acyl-CoA dehydrogenase family protein [Nocardia]